MSYDPVALRNPHLAERWPQPVLARPRSMSLRTAAHGFVRLQAVVAKLRLRELPACPFERLDKTAPLIGGQYRSGSDRLAQFDAAACAPRRWGEARLSPETLR